VRSATTSAAHSGIDLGQSELPAGWAMMGVCKSACSLYASGQSRLHKVRPRPVDEPMAIRASSRRPAHLLARRKTRLRVLK
jgi:hypothetical protein